MSRSTLEGVKVIEVDENDFMVDKDLQRVAMAGWVRSLMKTDGNISSPLSIEPKNAQTISLPPLEWHNYEERAKIMRIRNTGNTVLLKGEWENERPFLTGGPLKGCYVFSQVHFHWGPTDEEGSGHSLIGNRFVMEMHAVFFKAIYRTQFNALQNKDGVANLAYFFKLDEIGNQHLQPLLEMIPEICKPKSILDIQPFSLADLGMKDFRSDYYFYYGSMDAEDTASPAMWFIWPVPSLISSSQVDLFRSILSHSGGFVLGNIKPPLPAEEGKNLFFVTDVFDDALSEKEVREITPDGKSGNERAAVVSKTLRQKKKELLNTFHSFFSKNKNEGKLKTKWRWLSCWREAKKLKSKLQTNDHPQLTECKGRAKREMNKIEYEDRRKSKNLEEIEGNRKKSEESFREEEKNRGDAEVKATTPFPSKDENVKIPCRHDHFGIFNKKLGDAIENDLNEEIAVYNDEVYEMLGNGTNMIEKRERATTKNLEIYGEKKRKGIHVDVHELRDCDRLEKDEKKQAILLPVCDSLEVNAINANETLSYTTEEKVENGISKSVCEICRKNELENRLRIKEYSSEEQVSCQVCETDRELAAAEKADISFTLPIPTQCNVSSQQLLQLLSPSLIKGIQELSNRENLFPDIRKYLLMTRVEPKRIENTEVKIVEEKSKHYSGGPSKRVPELRQILELCKSNPDELLCVTVIIRDPRKTEINRRQVKKKYFNPRRFRGRHRVSNVPLLFRQESMPIIPEED